MSLSERACPSASAIPAPLPTCVICLCTCKNICNPDCCCHQYCFNCLLEWSKLKAECPLCKQSFKIIFHSKEPTGYQEYVVEQPQRSLSPSLTIDQLEELDINIREFINTDNTDSEIENMEINSDDDLPVLEPYYVYRREAVSPTHIRVGFSIFGFEMPNIDLRRAVYARGIHSYVHIGDNNTRRRECSARFYREYPAQIHRLMPWLIRDLHCAMRTENYHDIRGALQTIFSILVTYNINSPEFRRRVEAYVGPRTTHFISELMAFARSPYDIYGYDERARYDQPIVLEVTSSDSESEHVNQNIPINPSSIESPANSSNNALTSNSVVAPRAVRGLPSNNDSVELLSSDDSSDCQIVYEHRPYNLQNPDDRISINSQSDSDVVFVEPNTSEDAGSSSRNTRKVIRTRSDRDRLRRTNGLFRDIYSSSDEEDEQEAAQRGNEKTNLKSENTEHTNDNNNDVNNDNDNNYHDNYDGPSTSAAADKEGTNQNDDNYDGPSTSAAALYKKETDENDDNYDGPSTSAAALYKKETDENDDNYDGPSTSAAALYKKETDENDDNYDGPSTSTTAFEKRQSYVNNTYTNTNDSFDDETDENDDNYDGPSTSAAALGRKQSYVNNICINTNAFDDKTKQNHDDSNKKPTTLDPAENVRIKMQSPNIYSKRDIENVIDNNFSSKNAVKSDSDSDCSFSSNINNNEYRSIKQKRRRKRPTKRKSDNVLNKVFAKQAKKM